MVDSSDHVENNSGVDPQSMLIDTFCQPGKDYFQILSKCKLPPVKRVEQLCKAWKNFDGTIPQSKDKDAVLITSGLLISGALSALSKIPNATLEEQRVAAGMINVLLGTDLLVIARENEAVRTRYIVGSSPSQTEDNRWFGEIFEDGRVKLSPDSDPKKSEVFINLYPGYSGLGERKHNLSYGNDPGKTFEASGAPVCRVTYNDKRLNQRLHLQVVESLGVKESVPHVHVIGNIWPKRDYIPK